MTTDTLFTLIPQIQAAAEAIRSDLLATEIALELLDGDTCTGAIYWRNSRTPNPKMVVVHRKGQSCPVHGDPLGPDERIRSYVGSNQAKQAVAQRHIANEERRQQLDARARQTSKALWTATGYLIEALRLLTP